MSSESFNPRSPEYKKVEDLPKEVQDRFENVEGGFVRKSAADAYYEKFPEHMRPGYNRNVGREAFGLLRNIASLVTGGVVATEKESKHDTAIRDCLTQMTTHLQKSGI